MNTVFHLSTDDPEKVSELLGNIKNLKKDETIKVNEIAAVLNADGVKAALKASEAAEYLQPLMEDSLTLKVCSNSINGRKISEEELLEDLEIVSSGVGELNRLQDEGFNYIKI
ncbi:MAG: DsrE family protein [Candidatus Nanosalina sp.]